MEDRLRRVTTDQCLEVLLKGGECFHAGLRQRQRQVLGLELMAHLQVLAQDLP